MCRNDQIQLNAFPLVFGGRSIYGSLTGTPTDSEDTLAFSVLENIRPMIETFPLEQAADAYARMMQGKHGSAWCWSQGNKYSLAQSRGQRMDDPLARAIAAHGGFDRSNKFNNKVTAASCAPQAGGR